MDLVEDENLDYKRLWAGEMVGLGWADEVSPSYISKR